MKMRLLAMALSILMTNLASADENTKKSLQNENLRRLGHPSKEIAYRAIADVVNNNDFAAVPALIGLLNRNDEISGEVSQKIWRSAADALLKLTHNPVPLPKWNDENDAKQAREAWQNWFAGNASKTQDEWQREGDRKIASMLDSDSVDEAHQGFVIAKRLGVLQEKCELVLKKYNGKLHPTLTKNSKGKWIFEITNTGPDAIVSFKDGTYSSHKTSGNKGAGKSMSRKSMSHSPYLPDWRYSIILKQGDNWQTEISEVGSLSVWTVSVVERFRGTKYSVTKK
jgi:hypothetical protein